MHTNIDASIRHTLSILENLIQEMSLFYGTCSRIKTTPLCFGYVIHVRTIILIYLISCPPTLIAQGIASYALLLAMTVLTFAILTVDELAADCENPFGVSFMKKCSRERHHRVEAVIKHTCFCFRRILCDC